MNGEGCGLHKSGSHLIRRWYRVGFSLVRANGFSGLARHTYQSREYAQTVHQASSNCSGNRYRRLARSREYPKHNLAPGRSRSWHEVDDTRAVWNFAGDGRLRPSRRQ